MIDLVCNTVESKRTTKPFARNRGANNKHTITMPIASCEILEVSENDKIRLWSKIDIRSKSECWPWIARSAIRGYGIANIEGKSRLAHRAALAASGIKISNGDLVCHHCDNPPCCNPAHLFIGDHKTNILDMVKKGRSKKGQQHGSKTHPHKVARGIRSGSAKLSDLQVLEIRRLHHTGETQRELAALFEITQSCVSLIIHRRTWTHI